MLALMVPRPEQWSNAHELEAEERLLRRSVSELNKPLLRAPTAPLPRLPPLDSSSGSLNSGTHAASSKAAAMPRSYEVAPRNSHTESGGDNSGRDVARIRSASPRSGGNSAVTGLTEAEGTLAVVLLGLCGWVLLPAALLAIVLWTARRAACVSRQRLTRLDAVTVATGVFISGGYCVGMLNVLLHSSHLVHVDRDVLHLIMAPPVMYILFFFIMWMLWRSKTQWARKARSKGVSRLAPQHGADVPCPCPPPPSPPCSSPAVVGMTFCMCRFPVLPGSVCLLGHQMSMRGWRHHR